jgi:hypothetical protein
LKVWLLFPNVTENGPPCGLITHLTATEEPMQENLCCIK